MAVGSALPAAAIDYLLRTSPPLAGATVMVDGRQLGVTDRNGKAVLPRVTPGVHEVALVSGGIQVAKSRITFDSRLNLIQVEVPRVSRPSLTPPPKPAAPKEIDFLVDANVPGARVLVDGVLKTETSTPDAKAVLRLPVGSNPTIRLEREGFAPFEQSIRVEEIGNRLVARLAPLSTARPRDAMQGAGFLASLESRRLVVGALASLVVLVGAALITILVSRRRREAPGLGPIRPASNRFMATSFDRYRLEAVLGQGGVATIYRATDAATGGAVALKILDPKWMNDPEMVQKFMAEADALTAIRRIDPQSAVVRLLRSGREGERVTGCPFLALELLEGEDLEQRLAREGAFREMEAVGIAVQIARALDVVHRAGIVHRDLTPDNVFIVPGEVRLAGRVYRKVPRIVLLDFGVARQEFLSRRTMDGSIAGKPPYMSPEQCRGARVDARSDLYALGLILYALEAGKPPFVGKNPFEVMRMQERDQPPFLGGSFHLAYEAMVYRLLAKDPAERPVSAAVVASYLEDHFGVLVSPAGSTPQALSNA